MGVVRSVENYGIFIELAPNLAGLAECKDGLKVGQTASVYIKNIIPEKMKVKLIIVESFSEEPQIRPGKYFYTERRMTDWLYSPPQASKHIETVF